MKSIGRKSGVTGKRENSRKDRVFDEDYREKGSQHMWKNKSLREGETNFHYFRKEGENDINMDVWPGRGRL